MRGNKKVTAPAGTLISLGTKTKRCAPSPSASSPTAVKKSKSDLPVDVEAGELVSRTESALNSGNLALAESLVLSALYQLRVTGSSAFSRPASSSSSSGFRGVLASSGSRLLTGFSIGLLLLARSHPTLFARVSVLDQLVSLLSLSPRDLGISLPPAAVSTITARARGLHVLVANLIYLALENQSKWPSNLLKAYLEDSLSDRIWVDQDECRLFVLNVETAFPKSFGDPRGLFSLISTPVGGMLPCASGAAGSSVQSGATNAVQIVLGLCSGASTGKNDITTTKSDEITEAVSTVLQSQPPSIAKLIHGTDLATCVAPRFEFCRQAIEVVIVNTLREALGRRGPIGNQQPSSTPAVTTAPSTGGSALMSAAAGAPGAAIAAGATLGSNELTQLRSLLRTVAMAVGLPEVRGLVASRLENWLTNPKVHLFSVGLLALLTANCRLGGLSPHDLDLMITIIYRIRYKLLKPNMQGAFFECVNHMVKASPTNLYTLVNLCLASELRPPTPPDALESKPQSAQHFSQAVLRIVDSVRTMANDQSTDDEYSTTPQAGQQQLISTAMAAVAAGAAAVAFRSSGSPYQLLPFLHQRYPAQWVRLVGNAIHERMLLLATSCYAPRDRSPIPEEQLTEDVLNGLSPVFSILRELARNWRSSTSEVASGGSALSQQIGIQTYLPCAELAGAVLQDRVHRGNTTVSAAAGAIVASLVNGKDSVGSKGHIVNFQFYLNAIVSLIAGLQMLSASRPHLNIAPTVRRTNNHTDAMKAHQLALRQIRLSFMRWSKTIFPAIINAAVQSMTVGEGTELNVNSAVLACFEALKPSSLIRRAFMLDSISPLHHPDSNVYELFSCYPLRFIWTPDQDHSSLARLVTDACMPEKLAHQLLLLGLEPSWQLLSPLESLDIVCELIWHAACLARDSGLDSLNIVKTEQLIDLMYASCTYSSDQPLPLEISELAYAPPYWKTSITAVVLAASCPQSCGLFFWSNYPTIRRMLEMVITGDFACSPDSILLERDSSVFESEKLNAEIELQLIIRLETLMLNPTSDDGGSQPSVTVTPKTSKLLGRLVRNNPRGPCRIPPPDQLTTLQYVAEKLNLGRKLWCSREPDFLLELIRMRSFPVVVQPWLIRMVESSGPDLEMLPVQCLCEYFLNVNISKLQTIHKDFLPSLTVDAHASDSRWFRDTRNAMLFSSKEASHASEPTNEKLGGHLINRLREEIRTFGNTVASDALLHSFFTRLCDSHSLVRRAARQCLHLLVDSESTPASSNILDSVSTWLHALQRLRYLPILRNEPSLDSIGYENNAKPFQHLLMTVLSALLVENDLDILSGYVIFLSQVTLSPSFISWRPVIVGLTNFILTRSSILSALLHRPLYSTETANTAYLSLEALCDMFVRYIEYNCTAAEAIPIDENKSVFVAWSPDRQCPLELDCIQAQLLLLTHLYDELPVNRPPDLFDQLDEDITTYYVGDKSAWARLRDLWFISSSQSGSQCFYKLPDLSPFVFPMPQFHCSEFSRPDHFTFEPSTDGGAPRPCISNELRCRLIETNQEILIAGALWSLSTQEILDTLHSLTPYVLTDNTVDVLRRQLESHLSHCDESSQSAIQVHIERLNDKRIQPVFTDLDLRGSSSDPVNFSVNLPAVDGSECQNPNNLEHPIHLPDIASDSFWYQLVAVLKPMDSVRQAGLICDATHLVICDYTVGTKWLFQIDHELAILESTTRKSRGRMSTRKSPAKHKSVTIEDAATFFHSLCDNKALIRLFQPLISICVHLEQEPQIVGTRFMNRLKTVVSSNLTLTDIRQCLANLALFTGITVGSRPPLSVDVSSGSAASSPSLSELPINPVSSTDSERIDGLFLDSIQTFGLTELICTKEEGALCPESPESRPLKEQILRPIFYQSTSTAWKCSEYLLTELLDQADTSFLNECVRDLLQSKQSAKLNCTRFLDFLHSVLTLPRLTYPVPRSEPRDRPDAVTALSELLLLNVSESYQLLNFVLQEACDEMLLASSVDPKSSDSLLAKRTPLLDLAVTRWPNRCIHYLEALSGFFPLEESLLPGDSSVDTDPSQHCLRQAWRPLAQRLLVHLYLRWPGLVYLMRSCEARQLVRYRISSSPSMNEETNCVKEMYTAPPFEIDRLGSLILVGLTSANSTVCGTARHATQAMAIYHPHAFLRLLPILAALSEGRVGLSWSQFSARSYHVLFAHFLRLLELLAFSTIHDNTETTVSTPTANVLEYTGTLFSPLATEYSECIDRLLANLVSMLARFYTPSRRLNVLANKLARLLELYCQNAPWITGPTRGSALLDANQNVINEVEILASELDEFRYVLNLLSYSVNSDKEQNEQTNSGRSSLCTLNSGSFSKLNRKWSLSAISPFIQQLRNFANVRDILLVLEDLDNASRRRIDSLLYFKSELQRLMIHSDSTVSTLAVKLLLRLLGQYPHLASETVESTVIPYLSTKLTDTESLSTAVLTALPDLCLLAPHLGSKILRVCGCRLLSGLLDDSSFALIASVEESVRQLTLDGFDDASIEHAASALVSRSNVIRGT
ncbi:unnamed protein product [Dicrocoelium dendriticum]|nr:unnamed protein product [Dicrocoelium dendriticum]